MSLLLPANARGPILDLTLPASEQAIEIVLRNKTTGRTLALNLPAGWGGDDLSLDFFRRTITDQTGADRSALLDSEDNGLWSTEPLISGSNDVEIEAHCIESSTKSPGSVADDASVGTQAWTNAGNAKASDNTRATVAFTAKQTSHYLKATNYGFAVPVSATVLGVGVGVERVCASSGVIVDDQIRLVKAGTIQGLNRSKEAEYPAVEAVAVFGGSADLWGITLTPAQVNASDFGAAISARCTQLISKTGEVDHLPITVYWSPAFVAEATLRWEKGYY